MIGIMAQLRKLQGTTGAKAVALLGVLGLLASGLGAPQALAGTHGAAMAAAAFDCPMLGGPGAGHRQPAEANAGHHSDAGKASGPTAEGCGPTACCPADLAVVFEAPPPPPSSRQHVFGPRGSPPTPPGDRHDRPPRLS